MTIALRQKLAAKEAILVIAKAQGIALDDDVAESMAAAALNAAVTITAGDMSLRNHQIFITKILDMSISDKELGERFGVSGSRANKIIKRAAEEFIRDGQFIGSWSIRVRNGDWRDDTYDHNFFARKLRDDLWAVWTDKLKWPVAATTKAEAIPLLKERIVKAWSSTGDIVTDVTPENPQESES